MSNPKTATKAELIDMLEDAIDILNGVQMDQDITPVDGDTLGKIHTLFNRIPQDMAEQFLGR